MSEAQPAGADEAERVARVPPRRGARRGKRGISAVAFVAGVLLWIAAPVAGVAVLSMVSSAEVELDPPAAVWAPVERNSAPVQEPIGLALSWTVTPAMVAPAWSGVVQSVAFGPGDVVASGDTVVVVDGVARRAFATDVPLTRSLQRGDRGSDVLTLHQILTAATGRSLEGDLYGAATADAVREYAALVGASDRTGRYFDVGWVLFIARSGAPVREVDIIPGAPAPAPGASLLTFEDRLEQAALVESSAADPANSEGTDDDDSPAATEHPAGTRVVADAEQRLFVGGTEIAIAPDRETVAPESLDALRGLLDDSASTIPAFLSKEPKSGEFRIPTSAVFATADAPSCVIVRTTGAADRTAVRVDVVGNLLGEVVVSGELEDADEVVLSPQQSWRQCA